MPACVTQRSRGPCAYVESPVYKRPGDRSGLASDVASGGLGDRPQHHLVDVDMRWPGDGPNNTVRNIGARERLHALADGPRPLLVAPEPYQAELRLPPARLGPRH